MQIEIDVIDNKKYFLTRPILKIPIQEIVFDVALDEVIVVDNDAFLSSYLANMNLELDERQKRKTVYVLTNFGSTIEQDLYRIYTLRDLGFDPYVMIYQKETADRQHKMLQRYVNNKIIFKSIKWFEDYKPQHKTNELDNNQLSLFG